MSHLITNLLLLLHTPVCGKITVLNIILMVTGTLVPIILGLILPRKRTIHYGMWINKTLGLALLQRRHFGSMPQNVTQGIIATIHTTFQDVSFGVYIDARQDLSPEEKEKKINEYLLVEGISIKSPNKPKAKRNLHPRR